MHSITHKNGKPTGLERIVLPAFDLYSKNTGHGNGNQRIIIFAYKIRTSLDRAVTLKNIICKISTTDSNELTFIPYGMDSLGQEQGNLTRSMIIKQNTFLREVVVVPIFGVQKDEEEKFYKIFSNALYFSGLEPISKHTRRRKIYIIGNYRK